MTHDAIIIALITAVISFGISVYLVGLYYKSSYYLIPRFYFGEEEDELILDQKMGFALVPVIPPPTKLNVIDGGKNGKDS
jgi:hypothetical protein